MKVKLTAGAELDMLNKHEMSQVLRDWMVETLRGAVPIRFSAQGTVKSDSTVRVDNSNNSARLGPEAGMLWLVTRIVVSGLNVTGDPTALYVNDNQPWSLLFPSVTGLSTCTGYVAFSSSQVVLTGNDRLVLASTGAIGTAANTQVTLAGSAWELPVGLSWRLLG